MNLFKLRSDEIIKKHFEMRSGILLLFTFTFLARIEAQDKNPNYDAALAQELGADDYGMKSYILVILKSGTSDSKNEEKRAKSFEGHMENINRLVEEDKLIVAGPFLANENDFEGLFILNTDDLKEAAVILDSDPAIKARYLKYEMYPWYGSAALSQYLGASDKVWKINP